MEMVRKVRRCIVVLRGGSSGGTDGPKFTHGE